MSHPDTLPDRVAAVRSWARSRIEHCRDIEQRFSPGSDAMIESTTERRALQAVLRMLGGE